MSKIKKERWWAYLDDNGVIHIKRYVSDKQIQNCEQMPFCKGIFDPFYAWSYEEAKRMIAQFLTEQEYYEKKNNDKN